MLDVGTGGMLLVKYPELVKYVRERESCCQGGKVRQTMKENEGGEGGVGGRRESHQQIAPSNIFPSSSRSQNTKNQLKTN